VGALINREKLQKAVAVTIEAGYQLNSEAFEFLNKCYEDDPLALMNSALVKLKELDEKPFFIGKDFLESILKKSELTEKSELPKKLQPFQEEHPQLPIVEIEDYFYPYAKDIEAKINILGDSTGKLTSNGTLEEYIQYFQDRFKRTERILRQRIDVKSSTSILEALKSSPKTKLKIICMLTEKRESKKQIILTVEDLQGSATVLIPQKAPDEVHKKAAVLLPDQVICLALIKTRTNLFLAEDIIFPDVGRRIQQRSQEPVYAVLTSDIHIGSTKFKKEAFKRFILWLKGKYGNQEMKEIAGRVKYILVAGDIVDGVGIYPDQQKELTIKDIHKQYMFAMKYMEKIPNYIEIILSPGNHDASRKSLPQPAITRDYLKDFETKKNIHSVGSPCLISLHGVEILMYHGRSLDDIINTIPGLTHEHPEKAMRLFLQSRHLAPIYGGKTMLSPENRDYLVIDNVPDIFHAGHIHVNGQCNYRGVLVVNSGGWQDQTDYMEKLGLMPTPGKVPVVNLQTLEMKILSFN
jgi:DNA polymerase II small subunit